MKGKENGQYERDFPARLRLLLEKSGTNQNKLAEAIGKTRQTVSLYCSGQAKPDIDALRVIASFFGVTTDWLLGMPNAPMYEEFGIREIKSACGLSDISANNLVSSMLEGWNKPVDYLLRMECFPNMMQSLRDCDTLAFLLHNENDKIIIQPESPNSIALETFGFKEMSLNLEDFINVLITNCFNVLKEEYLANTLRLAQIPVTVGTIKEELAHVKEQQRNGDDNPTEE